MCIALSSYLFWGDITSRDEICFRGKLAKNRIKKSAAPKKRGLICFLSLDRVSVFLHYATLFDTGFLAGEVAEIVKLGTTYFAVFVNGNRIDEW